MRIVQEGDRLSSRRCSCQGGCFRSVRPGSHCTRLTFVGQCLQLGGDPVCLVEVSRVDEEIHKWQENPRSLNSLVRAVEGLRERGNGGVSPAAGSIDECKTREGLFTELVGLLEGRDRTVDVASVQLDLTDCVFGFAA